jgi:hypothetical protein
MLLVFDGGSGGREAEVISETVLRGSPLVCSMVVAMPRRSVRGARRRVARRSAIVSVAGVVRRWAGVWCGNGKESGEVKCRRGRSMMLEKQLMSLLSYWWTERDQGLFPGISFCRPRHFAQLSTFVSSERTN